MLARPIAIVFRVMGCLLQPAPGLDWLHDLVTGSAVTEALNNGHQLMHWPPNRRSRMLSG
jgi:hypothetical protein